MKRLPAIAAIATASMLLVGCQSKRDICARYEGGFIDQVKVWELLGEDFTKSTHRNEYQAVSDYCDFYKN